MRLRTASTAAVLAVVLALVPVTASATLSEEPSGSPGEDRGQGAGHRSDKAEAALDKALAIFADPGGAARQRDRRTPVEPVEDPTLVLRELAVRLGDLGPADREKALALLARPTDGGKDGWPGVKYSVSTRSTCDEPGTEDGVLCVHWVESTPDAPPAADTDGDGEPDQVEQTLEVFGDVRQALSGRLGYRTPVADDGGPGTGVDVYLADLGWRYGIFGYCVPEPGATTTRQVPGYCVVDDDFAEFGGAPLDDLRVTAAHEFFHLVQFAYTAYTHQWIYESTAMWVEDELYDHVNASVGYLAESPLTEPETPLDAFTYGGWIWWRYLSERYGPRRTSDPSVVRRTWVRLGNGAAPLTAMRREIASRDDSFGRVLADFGATNRFAKAWYDEGAAYPNAPAAALLSVTSTRRSTGWRLAEVDHLSNLSAVVRPGRGLRGRWRLRFELDLPPRLRGSQATVVVHRRDGSRRWFRPVLDRRGDAVLSVPFDRRRIARAALTFTNGGQGDSRLFAFRARAFRR